MKHYVIIGGGIAAVSCVEGIRSLDPLGEITMLCGEGRAAYFRPLISYCLQDRSDFDKIHCRPDSFYEDNHCRLIFEKAARIDPLAHTLTLEGGKELAYDSLCIATGSSPFVPPFEGLDTVENKFGFMTAADAQSLKKAATAESEVFIVGGGLIGLKCAEGLCGRVSSITVCDLAPRVLSSVLDQRCADLMQQKLEEQGVRFLLSDSPSGFEKNTALMKSGKRLHFDLLVLAVGVQANTGLLRDIGGACARGIIVDSGMRTSAESIFAAGDCAQGFDASIGESRVLAIVPNACMQGRCAGINMAGGSESLRNAIPMNAVGFFGLHALTAGNCSGQPRLLETDRGIRQFFIRDGLLSGFILVGDVAGAGIYTSMIRERTSLDSVDAEQLFRQPSLAAFSQQYRGKILGRVV